MQRLQWRQAKSWQNVLYEAEILHLVVQNAENPSVREGKMRLNGGVYAPKSTFIDATVARGFMPDGTVRRCTEIAVTFT